MMDASMIRDKCYALRTYFYESTCKRTISNIVTKGIQLLSINYANLQKIELFQRQLLVRPRSSPIKIFNLK